MSKKNRVTVNKSVITRASKLLECRIRDTLREHFRCPCQFLWVTSALPVLQGKESKILIDIYNGNQMEPQKAEATITLNVQGELKVVIKQVKYGVETPRLIPVLTEIITTIMIS